MKNKEKIINEFKKEEYDTKLKKLVEEYKKQGLVEGYIDEEGRTILPKID